MPETLSNQMPPPGEYPHHMPGSVTAEQVSAHLAENPAMYHPGLDSHMEANGITVDRSAELSPVDALEAEAATTAEANTAHKWGELADMPRTEVHVQEHEAVGRKLDPWYGERTAEAQTAISVIGELGEEAEAAAGVTLKGGENVAETSLGQELAQLPEKLQPRIAEALEASDFAPTPEVKEAIAGYYTDHYKLATVLDKVLDGTITPQEAEQIRQEPLAETYAIDQAIRGIMELSADTSKREDTLRAADSLIAGMLFKECAIGATTQTEQEAQIVSSLSAKLTERAVSEGFATTPREGFSYWKRQSGGLLTQPSEMAKRVRAFGDGFWKDSRYAGQLLFHNTSNFKDIALSGYRVMSRTQQLEETGTFYAQMAVDLSPGENMHSNAPHWSENYDPTGYKIPKNNATPGTLAVPMAEIIKTAPYARNAHYGIVVLKAGHEGVADRVTVNDKVDSIGTGSASDSQGALGFDRVFAAGYRADQASDAYKYAIDPGNKALQIFTTGEERVYYEGSDTYGIGETFPAKRILGYDYGGTADPLYDRPNQDLAAREAMKASLEEQVRTLQRQSRERPEYAGRYVVPLRQGVMEFVPEDGMSSGVFARAQKQVTHSSISAETARAAEARKRAA